MVNLKTIESWKKVKMGCQRNEVKGKSHDTDLLILKSKQEGFKNRKLRSIEPVGLF